MCQVLLSALSSKGFHTHCQWYFSQRLSGRDEDPIRSLTVGLSLTPSNPLGVSWFKKTFLSAQFGAWPHFGRFGSQYRGLGLGSLNYSYCYPHQLDFQSFTTSCWTSLYPEREILIARSCVIKSIMQLVVKAAHSGQVCMMLQWK